MKGSRLPARERAAWFFAPVPVHALVLCRIVFGLVLFVGYVRRWPYVDELYGPEGLGGFAHHQRFPDEAPLGWDFVRPFAVLQHVESAALIWGLYGLLLCASLAFALGWKARASGAIALALHALFLARNPFAYWGWATMIKPFLLYTILSPAGRYFSADAWLARRQGASPVPLADWMGPAWPLRLLQVHVCAQFLSVWVRLWDENWLQGRLLLLALTNRQFGRFEVDWLAFAGPLMVLSLAAFALEIGAPLALWLRGLGRFWALGLVGMFLGIEIATTVGWWPAIMAAALTAFLPATWLHAIFRGARSKRPAAMGSTRVPAGPAASS